MSIVFPCTSCQGTVAVGDEHAGKRGKCPFCGIVIVVPASRAAERQRASAPSARPTATAKQLSPPPGPSPAAKPPSEHQLLQSLLSGFTGEIPRRATTLSYRLSIAATAAFMAVLPLSYLLLAVGVAAFATGWAFEGAILPLVLAIILFLLMLKPLCLPTGRERRTRSVTRDSDPLLFAFVDHVCDAVRAPRPNRIDVDCDVNASAGFRRGWLSMFSKDMTLTIGIPLAAGLSLQQFAGVLAHEFGHFSQGTGMRLSYLIMSINHWFTRVTYEPDSMDEALAQLNESMRESIFTWRLALLVVVLQALLKLARVLIWLLMFVGRFVAGHMLRQMEFDADRYEAELAGSAAAIETTRRLRLLNHAYRGAIYDLKAFFQEGRLIDDLPQLIRLNMDQLPPEAIEVVTQEIVDTKTGWFDTHPADHERIAAVQALNARGVFKSSLPASVLFRDFETISKNVTWDMYCGIFGPRLNRADLHPVAALVAKQAVTQAGSDAFARLTAGVVAPLRPIRLPSAYLELKTPAKQVKETIVQARERIVALAPAYRELYRAYHNADAKLSQTMQVIPLLAADIDVSRITDLHVPYRTRSQARQGQERWEIELSKLRDKMEGFESAVGSRLYAALSLTLHPTVAGRLENSAQVVAEVRELLTVAGMIGEQVKELSSILDRNQTLEVIARAMSSAGGNQEALLFDLRDCARKQDAAISALWSVYERVPYPFDHARGALSIAQFALEIVPSEYVREVAAAADKSANRLLEIYRRALGRLSEIAEQIEKILGLPPLE